MKQTLGRKFLKTFINLRESNPVEVYLKVCKFLHENKIKHDWHYHAGLIDDFFGEKNTKILSINPGETSEVIIGKGVCFDSGGYDLKQDMKDMFYDKNGALLAIASAIDYHCSAIVFFVSNFIDKRVVAGQILTDRFTDLKILIDDTDAEGRIGLAHCIGLARQQKYKSILTIATLTGHAHMITGDRTYAMVHSNQPSSDLVDVCSAACHTTLELWPAPFHKEYDKAIDTKIIGADVRSCGGFKGAGTSTAFSFLKRFSKETHHIHLDMAAFMLDKNRNGLIWGLSEVAYLLSLLNQEN